MHKAISVGRHLRWTFLSGSALAALHLAVLAPTALARDAYVVNETSNSVSVINTQTNQVVGSPIMVGENPFGIAITPDGKIAYVANFGSNSVSVINTQTNQVVGSPITVGTGPEGIAITPDGTRAYVANETSNSVSVINTQTNQVVGSPITVGTEEPFAIAITPNGQTAYVTNLGSNSVSVISTRTNQVVGAPITVGNLPYGIAITPNGRTAYVANTASPSVSVISTQTNQVVGAPITVGSGPIAIAITPNGQTAYVANKFDFPGDVSVINTQTSQTVGPPITVGTRPAAIAIAPDQPPVPSFTHPFARPGQPVIFDASGSSDPDGTIASYAWSFGDGQTAANGGPSPSHTYGASGHLPGDLDADRQRRLLDRLRLHRADRFLQWFCAGKPDPDGHGRLPRGQRQVPEKRQTKGLRVQAPGCFQEAQGQGRERCGQRKAEGRALSDRFSEAEDRIRGQARDRQKGPCQGDGDDQRLQADTL